MLTIYGGPTYNVTKVVLTAEEAGLDYNYVSINLSEGEQRSPEHLKRHVLGKIPAIDHDGKTLFESAAICRYLAQTADSKLYSGDLHQRAVIDQWSDLMSAHIGRWLGTFFYQEFVRPNLLNETTNQEALSEAKGFLEQQLPAVDDQLGKSSFLAQDDITIADIIAFSYFQIQDLTSVDLTPYSNINRWYEEFKARPAVAKTNALVNG